MEEFLQEIERESRRLRMAPEQSRALLDEIAAHLDASVQARTELGASEEDAVSQAIFELGSASRLVHGVDAVARPKDRLLQVVAWIVFWATLPAMTASLAWCESHWTEATAYRVMQLAVAVAVLRGSRLHLAEIAKAFALAAMCGSIWCWWNGATPVASLAWAAMLFAGAVAANLAGVALRRVVAKVPV